MTSKRIFLFSVVALLLSSCATKKIITADGQSVQQGRWESHIKVTERKSGKSQAASADIIATRRGSFRIEVTALLGFPVASLVLTEKSFYCAMHTQKKFYWGPADEQTLSSILKMPLSPKLMKQIIFDEPIGSLQNLEVKVNRTEGKRTVLISSNLQEMKWVLDSAPTQVEITAKTFQLEPPGNYKVIRLGQ
jgi:outer membrane protein assembly factor BamE (lipoprotein component of BamABCDE complex)